MEPSGMDCDDVPAAQADRAASSGAAGGARATPTAPEQPQLNEERVREGGGVASASTLATPCASETDSDPGDRKYVPARPEEHDELLYDPAADDEDAAWVLARRSHKSDGLLSCPCCFTCVCVDCQQHPSASVNQFRALEVRSCTVHEAVGGATELKVSCDVCSTAVGLYDVEDEVFYLTDVLCSEC